MSKKSLKYSEAIEELNQILQDLETEKIDVDDVSLKVKRAIELIRLCREKIQKTEMEVREVVKEFEQELSLDKET
ncbi:MAG: exodeoxyribonuclease VII small subunit [Candidatus Omnitrophica bacterium]|nr:exodeoxyribonuclease VII small subunit [Candidatus Omnitrophota bacterium]MCM8827225.1 exodeoxyribonuclease VII small subunit [Candidatus Omnitrophota bacterium]